MSCSYCNIERYIFSLSLKFNFCWTFEFYYIFWFKSTKSAPQFVFWYIYIFLGEIFFEQYYSILSHSCIVGLNQCWGVFECSPDFRSSSQLNFYCLNIHLIFSPVLNSIFTIKIDLHLYIWKLEWKLPSSSHMNEKQS